MYRRIVTTVITAMVFVAVGSLGMYLYIEVEEFLALVEDQKQRKYQYPLMVLDLILKCRQITPRK